MAELPGLKATLKRGALVAAANWPLVAVQFVAESTLKVLLGVPVVGGIFLVVLLLGANADELLAGDLREIVAQVFAAMRQNVPALVAFSIAFTVVLLGGSALTFVIKGGTVSLLAAAEAQAGPLERPPVSVRAVRRANIVAIEPFLDGCQRLWRRYVRLGACLLGIYGATAALYLAFVIGGYHLVGNTGVLLGWTIATAIASSVLIVWITLVNFFYLLTQMVVAIEDISVRNGVRRALHFVRSTFREIAGIFGVVLLLAVIATIASIVATAGFGLINLIPILGLAVLPLQIAAWLVRGFIFQYLALAALGAYLTHYRHYAARQCCGGRDAIGPCSRGDSRETAGMTNYDRFLSRAAEGMQESAIRRMGTVLAQKRDIISFAPGYPAADTFPWSEFQEIARELLAGGDPSVLQYGPTRGYRPLLEAIAGIMGERGAPTVPERLLVTTGSQQGLDLVARVLVDPGDVVLVELPTYTGAITAFRNVQAQMVGVPQEADGVDLDALDEVFEGLVARGRRVRFLYVVPNFQNPTGLLIGLGKRRALLEWASRRDMLIVEDDPYRELFFEDSATEQDVRPIKADDQEQRVIYLSSFSKTLAPGFRVAWIDAAAPIASKLEMAKQSEDLLTGSLDQRVVYEACRRGILQRQLPLLRRHYQQKRDVMVEALRAAFGNDLSLAAAPGWILSLGHVAARRRCRAAGAARDRSRRDLRRR